MRERSSSRCAEIFLQNCEAAEKFLTDEYFSEL